MNQLETIVSIATNLTSAKSAEERYRQLLVDVRRVIPYDSSCLLGLDDDQLVPIAAMGLSADALGRRYPLRQHPRLEIIARADGPVVFPADSDLPDPFDEMLAEAGFGKVHACLGCPLRIEDELVGVLTADAAQPGVFDAIDPTFLAAVSALAAAELRTTHLIGALEKAVERQGQIARDLMRDAARRQGTGIIGTTAVMAKLRREIDLVARSDYAVLITGETGTGKELVAGAIHAGSTRSDEPMLYVNCAALPETLADSELFGHLAGAFTGATADRPGKFEVADGGTLFLDEIGELPLSVQPKLLRVLQQGEIQRVGSDATLRVDVRLVAATNRDLAQEVEAGRFRADLYHRLNVYPLRVPPLRERAADIPLLAGYFCDATRSRLGLGPVRLAPETADLLERYPWPGNVRELENVLSRVILQAAAGVAPGGTVTLVPGHFGPEFERATARVVREESARAAPAEPVGDLRQATRDFQRRCIERTLAANDGNWAAAARDLGMHRSNLHHLAKRLGMK